MARSTNHVLDAERARECAALRDGGPRQRREHGGDQDLNPEPRSNYRRHRQPGSNAHARQGLRADRGGFGRTSHCVRVIELTGACDRARYAQGRRDGAAARAFPAHAIRATGSARRAMRPDVTSANESRVRTASRSPALVTTRLDEGDAAPLGCHARTRQRTPARGCHRQTMSPSRRAREFGGAEERGVALGAAETSDFGDGQGREGTRRWVRGGARQSSTH